MKIDYVLKAQVTYLAVIAVSAIALTCVMA